MSAPRSPSEGPDRRVYLALAHKLGTDICMRGLFQAEVCVPLG